MKLPKFAALERTPWIWSAIGAFVLWITIGAIAQRGMIATIQGNAQIGAFLVLAGMGQMFVIASGNGNIDLSIPNVMTLSSLVALSVAGGDNSKTLVGILAGLGAGLLVGLFNTVMIFGLGVPAIVATLASGLLAESAILVRAATFNAVAPPVLRDVVGARVLGIPMIAFYVVIISILAAITLHRSRFGRSLFSVGQSAKAAERAGIPVIRTSATAYLLSGGLAAISGILLSAFTGPSISLGTPFLITSVAVVILGGTPIVGGKASVAGLWTAMLMLNLIITLVYVLKWSVAIQDIFEGLVILSVLTLAGGSRRVTS
jgi:ribose transport system permease protein